MDHIGTYWNMCQLHGFPFQNVAAAQLPGRMGGSHGMRYSRVHDETNIILSICIHYHLFMQVGVGSALKPALRVSLRLRILTQIKEEMDIEHVSFLGLFKERHLAQEETDHDMVSLKVWVCLMFLCLFVCLSPLLKSSHIFSTRLNSSHLFSNLHTSSHPTFQCCRILGWYVYSGFSLFLFNWNKGCIKSCRTRAEGWNSGCLCAHTQTEYTQVTCGSASSLLAAGHRLSQSIPQKRKNMEKQTKKLFLCQIVTDKHKENPKLWEGYDGYDPRHLGNWPASHWRERFLGLCSYTFQRDPWRIIFFDPWNLRKIRPTDQRSGGHRRPCDPVLCIALQGVALRTPSSSTRSSIVLPSSTWTESWFATLHFTHKSLASRYSISGPVWKPSGKTLQVIDSFFHARFLNQDGARRNRDSASRNSVQSITCYQCTPTNRYMSIRIICISFARILYHKDHNSDILRSWSLAVSPDCFWLTPNMVAVDASFWWLAAESMTHEILPSEHHLADNHLDHLDHWDHLDSAFWIGMDVKLETTSSAYISFLFVSIALMIDAWTSDSVKISLSCCPLQSSFAMPRTKQALTQTYTPLPEPSQKHGCHRRLQWWALHWSWLDLSGCPVAKKDLSTAT